MRSAFSMVLTLFTTLALAPALQAQDAAADDVRQELRTLVSGEAERAESHRAAVAGFLEREDVRAVATERGIDLDRVQDGLRTLDSDDARALAERVQETEQQLAGGDTFVITSTTVIIALLVVILIVVA